MRKPVIILPTYRRDGDYRDLDLAIRSIFYYTPVGVPVVVVYKDQSAGDIINSAICDTRTVICVTQPEWVRSGSGGFQYGFEVATKEYGAVDFVTASDDIVLLPDIYSRLVDEAGQLFSAGKKPGIVACRSNFIRGGSADVVSPVFAYVLGEAMDGLRWQNCDWFSDDCLCWDMRQKGYVHYTSSAYVHHVGERSTKQGKSTQQMHDEGRDWMVVNRPDFAKKMGWI